MPACLLLTHVLGTHSRTITCRCPFSKANCWQVIYKLTSKPCATAWYGGGGEAILQARNRLLMRGAVQDKRGQEWHQLAQRVFQDFGGFGKALSASEKQDVEKAASAEAWVHMVSPPYTMPLTSATKPLAGMLSGV